MGTAARAGGDEGGAKAEESAARKRLAELPGFTIERAEAARLTRLFGMTNRVYKVESEGERLCLRIPGSGAAAARIDRHAEEVNARLAAKAGVAPEVFHFDADGVMLTRFLDAETLLPPRLQEDESAIDRTAHALRMLHESGTQFEGMFRPFESIAAYDAALDRYGAPPGSIEQRIVARVGEIGEVLATHPSPPRPCHCDPTGRNVLDDRTRVWLVDWEYSGMSDPMWDLAYFSMESRFDTAREQRLLGAYLGRMPGAAESARMTAMKPLAEVFGALWALIQIAEGKTGGDFSGYAKAAFASAARTVDAADFRHVLEALRAG
jgi:thiamine kinase-like enzyme